MVLAAANRSRAARVSCGSSISPHLDKDMSSCSRDLAIPRLLTTSQNEAEVFCCCPGPDLRCQQNGPPRCGTMFHVNEVCRLGLPGR